MSALTPDQVATLKTRLLAEKKGLEAHLARIAKKDPHVKGDFDAKFPSYTDTDERDSDQGEDALEVTDYVNRIGLENVLELRLAAVERALARVGAGTYGTCQHCRGTESLARLQADPAAERCLHCKKLPA